MALSPALVSEAFESIVANELTVRAASLKYKISPKLLFNLLKNFKQNANIFSRSFEEKIVEVIEILATIPRFHLTFINLSSLIGSYLAAKNIFVPRFLHNNRPNYSWSKEFVARHKTLRELFIHDPNRNLINGTSFMKRFVTLLELRCDGCKILKEDVPEVINLDDEPNLVASGPELLPNKTKEKEQESSKSKIKDENIVMSTPIPTQRSQLIPTPKNNSTLILHPRSILKKLPMKSGVIDASPVIPVIIQPSKNQETLTSSSAFSSDTTRVVSSPSVTKIHSKPMSPIVMNSVALDDPPLLPVITPPSIEEEEISTSSSTLTGDSMLVTKSTYSPVNFFGFSSSSSCSSSSSRSPSPSSLSSSSDDLMVQLEIECKKQEAMISSSPSASSKQELKECKVCKALFLGTEGTVDHHCKRQKVETYTETPLSISNRKNVDPTIGSKRKNVDPTTNNVETEHRKRPKRVLNLNSFDKDSVLASIDPLKFSESLRSKMLCKNISNNHKHNCYKCDKCNQGFCQKIELLIHRENIHDIPFYYCRVCKLKPYFLNDEEYLKHQYNLHLNPCKLCGIEFEEKSELDEHMSKEHTEEEQKKHEHEAYYERMCQEMRDCQNKLNEDHL